jgi:hypothetical protein
VVGRREATCSAVSGKYLARPAWPSLHGSPWHGRRRHRPEQCPQPIGTSGAVLSSDNCGSSVERTAKLHPLWQTGTRQPVGCSMSACSRKTGRAPVR